MDLILSLRCINKYFTRWDYFSFDLEYQISFLEVLSKRIKVFVFVPFQPGQLNLNVLNHLPKFIGFIQKDFVIFDP